MPSVDRFLEEQAHRDGVVYALDNLLSSGASPEVQKGVTRRLVKTDVLDSIEPIRKALVGSMCVRRAVEFHDDIQRMRDLRFYVEADWR